jgi:mitogen-activated protein kinase 7
MPKVPFQRLFPQANPDALDLLDRMLAFDPSSRISVEEALEHKYLHIWHDASDEPACPQPFDFATFEAVEDVQKMREMILAEVLRFRHHVRHQPSQTPTANMNVPIPENPSQWSNREDARPQEAGAAPGISDLEYELQGADIPMRR